MSEGFSIIGTTDRLLIVWKQLKMHLTFAFFVLILYYKLYQDVFLKWKKKMNLSRSAERLC